MYFSKATPISQAIFALLLISVIVTAPASAETQSVRTYLPTGAVDAEALIGPPPEVGSATFEEEMAVVLWMQLTRTPEQIAFVQKPLNIERFTLILGDSLLTIDGRELKAAIDAVISEVRDEYDALKAVFDYPRPFLVSLDVEPVVDPRPVASYPSGHAIRSIIFARLLAEVFPEHRQALMELAEQIGYGRVLAGVHYPLDVLHGQKLANAYADVIVAQPAFKQALQRIRDK
jgi:acid phosphatase (class A)